MRYCCKYHMVEYHVDFNTLWYTKVYVSWYIPLFSLHFIIFTILFLGGFSVSGGGKKTVKKGLWLRALIENLMAKSIGESSLIFVFHLHTQSAISR